VRKLGLLVVGLVIVGWAVYQFWYLAGRSSCPAATDITARVLQHPAARQCASVTVTVEQCHVRLQGRVENDAQRERLLETVQKIRGITSVNTRALTTVEAPFCEVMDLLEPLQRHATARQDGCKARLLNKEGQQLPTYAQGEHLIIEVLTPATFASFVYVDYYTTDGQVQHLFPNLQEALNFFPRARYTRSDNQTGSILSGRCFHLLDVNSLPSLRRKNHCSSRPAPHAMTRNRHDSTWNNSAKRCRRICNRKISVRRFFSLRHGLNPRVALRSQRA